MQEWVEGYETECPVQFLGKFSTVFHAVNYYDKGHLPHSGGWAEQPAALMLMVEVVTRERADIQQRNANRGG